LRLYPSKLANELTLTKNNYMTENDVRSALKNLKEVFSQLDKLYELEYYLEAMEILINNLHYGDLEDIPVDGGSKVDCPEWNKVFTQVLMIDDFFRRAKKFVKGYDESIRDKLCVSEAVLTEIDRELSEDKSLAIPTNNTTETCNMVTLDIYHPWD